MKLVRDVLQARGTASWRRRPAPGVELAAEHAPTRAHGHPASRYRRRRGARAAARRTSDRLHTGPRADRIGDDEDRERFLAAGFDGYLSKPINVPSLSRVGPHLHGHARESEHRQILVVDDVPENVRLLEAVLAPRGYDVVSATDGNAALGSPSPRTGPRAARRRDAPAGRLRGLPAPPRARGTAVLPVIMLTASGGRRRRRRSRPGRTTSSRSRSIRTSCSRASARCSG